MWRPLVGLLDELTVHFVLELRVRQAHLQGILGQRGVVIHGWRLNQHVDEELTGLRRWDGSQLVPRHDQQAETNAA